jgi:hypothetical protein
VKTVPTGIALPEPGELWRSGAPHYMTVRVLAVDLIPSPTVEYEVLDEDGSSLTGPLRLPLDASWRGTFNRYARGAAA